MRISVDFETRSTVDLRKAGVYRYAEDPTTDLWCMAWAVDGGDPQLWTPGQSFPAELAKAINAGGELRAWNAAFERIIWRDVAVPRHGFPAVGMEQWVCTAAEAAAMSLPRSLAKAAAVLGVSEQKDDAGHRLMMRMSRPRSVKDGEPIWWDVPERIARLGEYCKQDVRTERTVLGCVRRLTPSERQVYLQDQRINDRGISVDVPLIHATRRMVTQALDDANEQVSNITDGAVTKISQVGRILTWLSEVGVDTDSIAKARLVELLAGPLPAKARQVLQLRQLAAKSSVAKLDAFLRCVCEDGRVRGLLLYHGAGTGRWSGRLVQPQNFPRGSVASANWFIPLIKDDKTETIAALEEPLEVAASVLRGVFRAGPGAALYVGDYAQIEARVLAWLAGETKMIDLFASGGKVYESYADNIARMTETEPDRQLGKATVLGCGYGMGADKFRATAHTMFGVLLPPIEYTDDGKVKWDFASDVVNAYRELNPHIVKFWRDLGGAAFAAVATPGRVFSVRGCRFTQRGAWLYLILPSGRPLCYARPRLVNRTTPWGEKRPAVVTWGENSQTRIWSPRPMYGGLWAENIVQATARDLMVHGMRSIEEAGYDILLTVHDEIVAEAEPGRTDFNELMKLSPSWAKGCPVEADTWTDDRYRKE